MKNLFFLLTFFLSLNLWALPKELPTIDNIVEEFRGALKIKVGELGKNFIRRTRNDQVHYLNSEPTACLMWMVPAKETLVKIQYRHQLNETKTELSEEVVYYGCKNELALREKFTSKGTDLERRPISTIEKGSRSFMLAKNENFLNYQIVNDRNDVLFHLTQRREDESTFFEMRVLGELFLRGQFRQDRAVFRFYPFNIDYKRDYMGIGSRNEFTPYTIKVVEVEKDKWRYLGATGVQLSLNNFLRYLSSSLNERVLNSITSMVKYQLYWFPATSFTGGAGKSQRLINEFKLLLTRLLNNTPTELTLVKNFVRNFITAIEGGEIVDNRKDEAK